MKASDSQALGGEPGNTSWFLFEVDGVPIGTFREVTGLQLAVTVDEYVEGGQNGYVHKLPGVLTWPNLVFKRGLTDSNAVFDWMTRTSGEGFAGAQNKLVRSTGAVTAIDSDGTRLRKWEFIDLMPVRWKGPDFSVESTNALEEELEIAHHGFRASKPSST